MRIKEKDILKKVVDYPKGTLSPAEMINGIAKRDTKSVHNLITDGYLEEVETQMHDRSYNFYRATKKGRLRLDRWYKRTWFSIKNDLRTILVAVLTTMITTVIIYFLAKWISKI